MSGFDLKLKSNDIFQEEKQVQNQKKYKKSFIL